MAVATTSLEQRPPDPTSRARVLRGIGVVAAISVVLSFTGSFAGSNLGPITYVAALCTSALVILLAAMDHPVQARSWLLIGSGATIWALGGFLITLQGDAAVTAIPDIAISLCYTLGYLPMLVGFADLSDPQLRSRRLTGVADGVLLFLVIYAVLWLLVVDQVAADSELPKLDRAFSAIYPAGDLALIMLAVRIIATRAARRRVGALLMGGAVLSATADVSLLVLYLLDPEGSYPLTDLSYLLGMSCIAMAALWSLLPAPPASTSGAVSSRRLATIVAVSSFVPPLVLGGVLLFSDRAPSLGPIAVWILLAVAAAVLRHMSSVKELETVHEQSLWLASHDPVTKCAYRDGFLHEVSAGGLRDRTGTIVVVEAVGLNELRDARGYDAVDEVMATMAARLRAATGEGAVLARLAHDQLVAFLRSADLARGRQVADGLQRTFAQGTPWGDGQLALAAIVGVAQADGAVIDVQAGVRRAVEAARMGRAHGPGFVAIDADLTGSAAAVHSPHH